MYNYAFLAFRARNQIKLLILILPFILFTQRQHFFGLIQPFLLQLPGIE